MRCYLLAGERAEASRQYAELERRLRAELGAEPEAETRSLMADGDAYKTSTATRYAYGGGVHIAYQTRGAGDVDVLLMPGFVSSVERVWELPAYRSFAAALMTQGRLIVFDTRGIGLSDRGVPTTPHSTVEDMDTVLRATKSRRAVLIGASQSGCACIRFAVENPGRVAGLILIGVSAKGCRSSDYPFALSAEQFDVWRRRLVADWGSPIGIDTFGPSLGADKQAREWWAALLRAASSPGALKLVLGSLRDVDVRSLLPQVSAPTLVLHRRHDRAVRVEAGRYIAARIPGARFLELEGADHWFFAGEQAPMLAAIRSFIGELCGAHPKSRR
jgi:pimeloyl-ACP methyl ester carboxylesterase